MPAANECKIPSLGLISKLVITYVYNCFCPHLFANLDRLLCEKSVPDGVHAYFSANCNILWVGLRLVILIILLSTKYVYHAHVKNE